MNAPRSLSSPRLTFIDALRGFALFGVFGANLMIFSGLTYMSGEQREALWPGLADRAVHYFEHFFVENKFMGLFSFLFGISFWLFLDRVGARGAPATKLFYRRIGWLLAIGMVHGWLLWCFDILRFYALWGLFLALFLRTPPRRLLGYALSASILIPAIVDGLNGLRPQAPQITASIDALTLEAFTHGGFRAMLAANWKYDWYLTLGVSQISYQVAVFGHLLLGLWAARTLDLAQLDKHREFLKRLLLPLALIGIACNAVYAFDLIGGERGFLTSFVKEFVVESGYVAMSQFYACGLALLFLSPRLRGAVAMLAPLGQMALSWYLLQTIFGLWLYYGFMPGPGLMGSMRPLTIAAIWFGGYALQVVLARLWMRRFRFGPAEWAWRSLTYWKRQPFGLPAGGHVRQGL